MKRAVGYVVAAAAAVGLVWSATGAASAGRVAASKAMTIVVKSDSEHAKKGPDGKWHDAFLPADPAITAGVRTTITLVNYDGGPHSMVAPGLNLNVVVPAAKGGTPGRVSFTLKVGKPGRYDWWCTSPCDPWAMTHDGYMRGSIVVAT
jgi:plastocyanin